jgi:signal transduction histidine kinase
VDEPDADVPRFFLYPPDVLSGDGVRGIAQDESGHLYIGGDQGVQRLDPATGRVRRYTTADGLPSGDVEAAFVDAEGRLWLGTWRGMARFVPPTGPAAPPPSVVIGSLTVRGEPYPIAELGETDVAGLELTADQNQLEVGFFALAFGTGRPPQYQYRLAGADADWGPPTTERRVTYVSLSPGPYRFLVRAVTADGAVTDPAGVSFVILRPVWRRPWFVALAAMAALLLGASVYRARVERLLAVERIRTRIASDLHDDIGSSLSQIAVLTEVVRQRNSDDAALGAPLARIATTSREALESMNDIVWAINPKRDSLTDVVQRMRRFANDVLGARGIEFTFHAPADAHQVRLGADVRRHVYLIFKEAVNNLVRHAASAEAAIELSLEGGQLILQVTDTGIGFDPAEADRGHGLASMRGRAAAIRGALEITAEPGRGTRLRLEVPLGRRTRR